MGEVKAHPLLFQDLLERPREAAIKRWANAVHKFNEGDLGAKAAVDRAELYADNASADDG